MRGVLYLARYDATDAELNINLVDAIMDAIILNIKHFLYAHIGGEWQAGIISFLILADIFDHVYAVIHEFGMRIYQTPAGTDFAATSLKQL